MNLKDNLRKLYRQKRVDFCAQNDKRKLDEKLAHQIVSILPSQSTKHWGSYSAYKSEADPTQSHVQRLQWVFPVVVGEGLKFYAANSREDWVPNDFGILEPKANGKKEVPLTQIEGLLIPGLVFDKRGCRLGSGKGFYDKTLMEFKGLKVGVCYSCQLVEEDLPTESHDVRVDMVITEQEVISMKGIRL